MTHASEHQVRRSSAPPKPAGLDIGEMCQIVLDNEAVDIWVWIIEGDACRSGMWLNHGDRQVPMMYLGPSGRVSSDSDCMVLYDGKILALSREALSPLSST
ncbi:MAG: hypothetical protein EBR88_01550 [Betaproteobacteria bacterium]|nr:hypothetical protein [Betaproteobacteria bacterium]